MAQPKCGRPPAAGRADQPSLWPEDPTWGRPPAGPDRPACYACPGCGAKPGAWRLGRFAAVLAKWGYVPLCVECARIPEVMLGHLRDYRPPPPTFLCNHQGGSDERLEAQAERVAAGEALSDPRDAAHRLPAVWKVPTGPPDTAHDPGFTGVEKCGKGHRARPFWRGRKWALGTFPTEREALDAVHEFWTRRAGNYPPNPILWLPCSDEDGAVAFERESLPLWRGMFPGLKDRRICRVARAYMRELKRTRVKPPYLDVWRELMCRLAAAAGPTVFGPPGPGCDESAELLGA